jgi:hypothetical protein
VFEPVPPDVSDRPVIERRHRRLVAYLSHNRHQLLVDAAILLAWMVGSATLFRRLALPPWLHYLVLFLGVVIYARVTPNWERPYRSLE